MIPVDDELPPPGKVVYVTYVAAPAYRGQGRAFIDLAGNWFRASGAPFPFQVTHWTTRKPNPV